MSLRLRYVGSAISDLVRYTLRTGRWWVVLGLVAVALAFTLATAAQTAVPTVVYTLF